MNKEVFPCGAVNAEDVKHGNDFLCNYADISKYPTLKFIEKDGSLSDYKDDYKTDNLIYFINIQCS